MMERSVILFQPWNEVSHVESEISALMGPKVSISNAHPLPMPLVMDIARLLKIIKHHAI
jgi:hypothetical protein